MRVKAIKVDSECIEFEGGIKLESYHMGDCCEHHWLEFNDLTIEDFEGLEFDLSGEDFFKRIPDYGIELIPLSGHSVKIAGHGSNNGYYSCDLDLVVHGPGFRKNFDISECQIIVG